MPLPTLPEKIAMLIEEASKYKDEASLRTAREMMDTPEYKALSEEDRFAIWNTWTAAFRTVTGALQP